MSNINKKEQNATNNPFYSLNAKIKADQIFNDFEKRVKANEVKNDGTDELLNIIDKYVLSSKENPFFKTLNKGTKLYRARIVDIDSISTSKGFNLKIPFLSGFNESESREPPLGISKPGRNNIEGVSFLYLANNPETACCEVKPSIRQIISLAEFELVATKHIVDFSKDVKLEGEDEEFSIGRLFTEIMGIYSFPISNDSQYRTSQILTDYIRKTGIDGIAYRSYFSEKGINYTLFNSDHRSVRYLGSRLLLLQSERRTFLDFDNERIITAESVGGATYDKESSQKMARDIMATISMKAKE